MLSGEKIGQWVYKVWPFDLYASIVVFLLSMLGFLYIFSKLRPKRFKTFQDGFYWSIGQVVSAFIGTITLPWKIIQGLIMEKDAEGKFQFAGFKMMFMLCSFVMLFRLSFSGGTISDLHISPSAINNTSNSLKKTKKRKIRKNNTPKNGFFLKKLEFSHLAFYELLVFLTFCFMYYYRKDLNEGDQENGLDKVLDTAREAILLRYGGSSSLKPPVPSMDPITPERSPEVPSVTGRRKSPGATIISKDNDPFLS